MYTEQVLPIRVMRQLNDAERNPNQNWSLVFSTTDMAEAVAEMQYQASCWARTGDAFKIVDAGKSTTIQRLVY